MLDWGIKENERKTKKLDLRIGKGNKITQGENKYENGKKFEKQELKEKRITSKTGNARHDRYEGEARMKEDNFRTRCPKIRK